MLTTLLIGLIVALLVLLVAGSLLWRKMPNSVVNPSGGVKRMGAAQRGDVAVEPVAIPQTIGPYRIEKRIGQGAMGVVFLGRDSVSDDAVAIKTLALEQAFDPGQLEEARMRFFAEAETAARLHHQGIVSVIASGEEADLVWMAMEYVRGEPLSRWIEKSSLLPLSETLAAVRQTALALEHAHRQQVVHRDVKPENILYDQTNGRVKVMDFGVARLTDLDRTRTGRVLGTPAYMSPEQLAGEHIDFRSDLFSLGVVLYELTTGQRPFRGDSLADIMFAIVHGTPDDPRLLNPRLPAALTPIVMKALQKEPAGRFQSGSQLALALVKLELALKKKGESHGESRHV